VPPVIWVLAGTNGAGKSSIGGAIIRRHGADYFNPDEAARELRTRTPGLSAEDANAQAWNVGRRLLEHTIDQRLDFAFETTLGGNTITRLLHHAIALGFAVRIWYAGLASPDLHIARVKARVARGGHDIPDDKIRARYDQSRLNLIDLLPGLDELRVFDNSDEGDPAAGVPPRPRLLLHIARGSIVQHCDLPTAPAWVKPVLAAALARSPRHSAS
jgi:predicted ABC-type ATPase